MTESMNCPNCQKPVDLPEGKVVEKWVETPTGRRLVKVFSQDRDCPHCSASLRHSVPVFAADTYGWHWELAPGQIHKS